MNTAVWVRLAWYGRQWINHGRFPVVLAVSLALVAVLLAVACFQQREQLESMRQQALRRAAVPMNVKPLAVAAEEELQRFYEKLPPMTAVPRIIQDIHGMGEKSGVAVSKGVYKVDKSRTDPVWRVTLRFPLEGRSGKIEPFVWEVMKKYPSLSLEGINFHRATSIESEGSAEIRFVLFARAASVGSEDPSGKTSEWMVMK